MSKHVTIAELVRTSGLARSQIDFIFFKERISFSDQERFKEVAERIIEETDTFISLNSYGKSKEGKSFKCKGTARERLLEHLKRHDFFGLETYRVDQLIIGRDVDMLFFKKDDIPKLDACLEGFFTDYGRTEEEKIMEMIQSSEGRDCTVRYLRKYLKEVQAKKVLTSSHTAFVKAVLAVPDVSFMTNEDVVDVLRLAGGSTAKAEARDFLNSVKSKENVHYGKIVYENPKGDPKPAYPYDTCLRLAKCLFNAEHIADKKMIEKALKDHFFAEMWLYLSLFFCCGARAQDVCRQWKYPHLSLRKEKFLGIDTDSLYEDILEDKIPDAVYIDVCRYCIGAMEISGDIAAKNSSEYSDFLHSVIHPGLYTFFGLLTLIAEAINIKNGEGYMQKNRVTLYQNKFRLKEFFGKEMWDALDGRNIMATRLNKAFLQGIEDASRKNGCGSVMASAVASYARGHRDLNTIRYYLQDGKLTGDTAKFVLYEMLDTGVFSFVAYQTLVTAYPAATEALPIKKRTELIKMMGTPLEIEQRQSELASQLAIHNAFITDNKEEALSILKVMCKITQSEGKGKDTGVYCLLRTRHEACEHPEWKSCLANGCGHLVLTRLGIRTLIEVLNDYYAKEKNGDKKAGLVLRKILVPRYQDILNTLMKSVDISKEDREGIKKYMKEVIKIG